MTNEKLPEPPRDLRTLELTTREVKLLLKYGYPFEDEQKTLRASRAVKGYHRVQIGAYWIEMMIADLIRSAKECRISCEWTHLISSKWDHPISG